MAGTAAALVAGCASTVTMELPTIPKPRLEKIPVDVAVRIPAEFHDFTHVEEVLGRDTWTIELGSSNARFFEQLFGHMFRTLVVLGPDDDPRDFEFDALIEPAIEGFEFSVPAQTQTNAFAVWIRYRMAVYDSVGNRASSWTVNAYGKSRKEGLGGSDSLERAAILAMRDAAALIIMQMEKVTRIRDLADGPLDPATAEPGETLAGADTRPENDEPESVIGIFAIGGIDDAAE
ncbi:MAG: hypothetical protein MJA32_06445 [Proteobacteria bacterium]|nr:hypothetical protein [Pseudomonadota bacterium]